MPGPQLQGAYTREQILRVAGVTSRQLKAWEGAGLVPERDLYTMADLKALQTLQRLRNAGFGPKRIQSVFQEIGRKLHGRDPLTDVTVVLERKAVHVIVDGHRMVASSGQLLLNFDQQEISRLLSFPAGRKSEKEQDRDKRRMAEAAGWFERGLDLEQTGSHPDEAIEAYEKALELDPECVGALVNLGTVCFHMRQWKRAERYYKKALEVQPGYALGHFNLGNLYDERGEVAQAFHHYGEALKSTPGYADAHYNLALLCQRTGQLMLAVRHWQTYLKLDPGSTWADVARRELQKLRTAAVVKGPPGSGSAQQ